MWILGIRKGSEAWRRKGAEEGGERESGFRDTEVSFVCGMVGCRSFFRVQKLAGTSRISLIDLVNCLLCKTIYMH